ncbi:hypothetical protein ACERZ8_00910 [Tateyamaria armeniaca]|uniref:Uncharacterized protein n=1 Tax=Tateyamaria armeniaca TaxID=2518930 RepID=A0ABW8UQY7_9RHOB
MTTAKRRVVGGQSLDVSHSDLFGTFAIGISQAAARTVGLQPVVYHYRSELADSLSEKIQEKMEEVRALLGVLAYLEASVGAPDKFRTTHELRASGYVSTTSERAVRLIEALPKTTRKQLFDAVTELPRSTSWNLIDWLDHFGDHFQTADGQAQIGTLSYYMQNEWRVGRMQFGDREVVGLDDTSHPAILEVRDVLSLIDTSFFTPTILSECALLATVQNHYFFDHVVEVICPRAATRDVEVILQNTDPNQFVRTSHRFAANSVFERKTVG